MRTFRFTFCWSYASEHNRKEKGDDECLHNTHFISAMQLFFDVKKYFFGGISVAAQCNMPAIHPGLFLKEILDEAGFTPVEFAKLAGLSPDVVCDIVDGRCPITTEIAEVLGAILVQAPGYWLNLQASYNCRKK